MSIEFYTNPMSRGQIVRWMLEEVGEPYQQHIVNYGEMGSDAYRAVNPMAKVPSIVHEGRTVTECAAICAYLADAFPAAGLAPREEERADYYRWLFFAAGPVEAAVTNHSVGWDPTPEQRGRFGYGDYDSVVDTLDGLFSERDFVCGDRFTAADVYVGSQVMWGTSFGTLPKRASFEAYGNRLEQREAYKRAKDIDNRLIAEMKAAAPA